jgi:cyanate lyase
MIPINPQTIRSASGEELVVLTRAEFEALTQAASEALEDADDTAIFDLRMAELKNGGDARLPPEVTAAMLEGDTLLRALRRWKNKTQVEVANATGLAQGYISDLEAGRKSASDDALRKIAAALDIDPAWLGVNL